MDTQSVRRLIEKGQLEEALRLMARELEGSPMEEESFLLYARYRDLDKERAQGVASWEEVQREQNRIRQAALRLLSGSPTVMEARKNKAWPGMLLLALAAILAVGGLWYLQYGQSNARPEVQEAPSEEVPAVDSQAAESKRALPGQENTATAEPAEKPKQPTTVWLSGTVSSQAGEPLQEVEVSLSGSATRTRTDASGYFELQLPADMPKGEARLIYRKEGYQPLEKTYFELPKRDIRVRLKPKTPQE